MGFTQPTEVLAFIKHYPSRYSVCAEAKGLW